MPLSDARTGNGMIDRWICSIVAVVAWSLHTHEYDTDTNRDIDLFAKSDSANSIKCVGCVSDVDIDYISIIDIQLSLCEYGYERILIVWISI